jgi:hypothetical protein
MSPVSVGPFAACLGQGYDPVWKDPGGPRTRLEWEDPIRVHDRFLQLAYMLLTSGRMRQRPRSECFAGSRKGETNAIRIENFLYMAGSQEKRASLDSPESSYPFDESRDGQTCRVGKSLTWGIRVDANERAAKE